MDAEEIKKKLAEMMAIMGQDKPEPPSHEGYPPPVHVPGAKVSIPKKKPPAPVEVSPEPEPVAEQKPVAVKVPAACFSHGFLQMVDGMPEFWVGQNEAKKGLVEFLQVFGECPP